MNKSIHSLIFIQIQLTYISTHIKGQMLMHIIVYTDARIIGELEI